MSLREAIDKLRESQDDLRIIHKHIAEYRGRVYQVSSPQNDGTPKAKGNHTSKVERASIRLVELEGIATAKQEDITRYQRIIYEYISAITDTRMRILLKAHFLDGLSWDRIARFMKDGNCADANKKAVYRFLKEYEKVGSDAK